MKIIPLAFDSFGVRSTSTFVETENVHILLDPGVSLAPKRFGLAPHRLELKREEECWKEIVRYAKQSEIIIITHYHYDHYNPEDALEMYKDKKVFLKHPTEAINLSQKKRAKYFLEQIKGLPDILEYSDGREFQFGGTKITFSQPVCHGTDSKLGYVTEVLIDDGYRFVYTSDVEGPSLKEQAEFILRSKPNLLVLDGPLSYMLGYRYSLQALAASVKNMVRIIQDSPLDGFIIDHHLLRDLKWRERLTEVFEAAEKGGIKVQTAADFAGRKVQLLEARRKELYSKGADL